MFQELRSVPVDINILAVNENLNDTSMGKVFGQFASGEIFFINYSFSLSLYLSFCKRFPIICVVFIFISRL